MKKRFIYIGLLLGCCLFSLNAVAQVQSILSVEPNLPPNQNPFFDASQKFDISVDPSSNGKGFVFPRVDLTTWTFSTQFLAPGDYYPGAFDGMIVYNIGTGNTLINDGSGDNPNVSFYVTPGFYYFFNPGATDGSHTTVFMGQWIKIGEGSKTTTPSGVSFPTSPAPDPGDVFYRTDTNLYFYYNGSGWITVSTPPSGNGDPGITANTKVGDTYYQTNANPSLNVLKMFNGTDWTIVGGYLLTDATMTGDGKTAPLGLAANAVTSDKIVDGTIVAADLSQMGAFSGQVMKWNGTAWVASDDNNSTTTVEDVLTSTSATNALSANQGNVLNTAIGSKLNTTATFGGDVSGTYDNLQISTGTITENELADNAVTSAKIDDGTIAASDLSQMGATNNQVMKWNGTAWVASDDISGSVTVIDNILSTSATDALSANMGRMLNNAVVSKLNAIAAFGGDVTGTYNNIQISPNTISTVELTDGAVLSENIASNNIIASHLSSMGASSGQILKYNGSSWLAADDNNSITIVEDVLTSTSATNALSANQGNVLYTAIGTKLNATAAFGGDVSGTYDNLQLSANTVTETELANNAVTSAKIADATIVAADLNAMGATSDQILKYNGTAWAPAADIGIASASNGLTVTSSNVALGGSLSTPTVIDQGTNNLTLTSTGTGRTIVNGTLQTNGAVYANVRILNSFPGESDWLASDYIVIIHVAGAGAFTLPNPTSCPGRMLLIRNDSSAAGEAGLYGYSTYVPVNNGSVLPSRAQTLVSDGTNWYVVSAN